MLSKRALKACDSCGGAGLLGAARGKDKVATTGADDALGQSSARFLVRETDTNADRFSDDLPRLDDGDFGVRQHLSHGRRDLDAHEDDAARPRAEHGAQQILRPFCAVVRLADGDAEPVEFSRIGDSAQHSDEIRCLERRHETADQAARAGRHPRGQLVGDIPHLGHGGRDPVARFLHHLVRCTQCP